MKTESLFVEECKALINAKHLLKHPFYQEWEKGTLSRDVMQKYAEQYYHLEKNFPLFLSGAHAHCEDLMTRRVITDNLYDEEHGDANHLELWLQFCEALGTTREHVEQTSRLPETESVIQHFIKESRRSPLAGIAALAAYEEQIPEISQRKIHSLRIHYGITDEPSVAFFHVHGMLDRRHADAWWQIIEQSASSRVRQDDIRTTITESRDRLWEFLDGICRAYLSEISLVTP